MGQYHHTVSMDAQQSLNGHSLGSGIKAYEQVCGATVAALTTLISRRPGNMPGDLNDPMIGAWAGHRLLVVGDYAEKKDIRGFKGAPLDKLYSLCRDEPKQENYQDSRHTEWKTCARTGRYIRKDAFVSAKMQYAAAMKEYNRVIAKHSPFPNVGKHLLGLLEEALSVRFVESNTSWMVPVEAYAVKGDDMAHYMLPANLDEADRKLYFRVSGIPEDMRYPDTLPGGRWPWDRAPLNRAQHSVSAAQADMGQRRVFVNLDRRECFDPIAFGEQPTTAGIMQASDNGVGSASALFAMLLHPEVRGGGDISQEEFPEIGRWRNNRIVLTAETESGDAFPTTAEALATFKDISPAVVKAAATLGNQ